MTGNGRRPHLIERAALRLDGVVQRLERPTAPNGSFAVERPQPFGAAAPDGHPEAPLGDRRPVIDGAALKRAGMVDWQEGGSRVAEEFRIALTEMLRQNAGAGRSVAEGAGLIMITSALPGEGKSFTALNLAVGIARHDAGRVLLVDADGRQGGLGDLLGVSAERDIAAAIDGVGLDPARLGARTCIENLDFLRLSNSAQSSDEASAAMLAAIERLARQDRLVLIDAPPCLSSSRPHLLAPIVGQTVLVIAAGTTQHSDIEAALGMIRTCPGVSLLLNRIGRWQAHSFGSYGAPA